MKREVRVWRCFEKVLSLAIEGCSVSFPTLQAIQRLLDSTLEVGEDVEWLLWGILEGSFMAQESEARTAKDAENAKRRVLVHFA
jgi:hypothetical protein